MTEPVVITSIHGTWELALGLKQGTLEHLRAEHSDWGRIIKAQAITEAALNARLAHRFPERGESVTRLSFSHRRYGKLAILTDVGWLTDHETAFLKSLHRLRSVLVHDVSYLDFDLDEQTDRWTASQRVRFVDVVFDFWYASNKVSQSAEWEVFHKENLRFLLFGAVWRFIYDTDERLHAHRAGQNASARSA